MTVASRLIRAGRERSEVALLVVLPATVVAFAAGSGSVADAVTIGRPLRWILLFALALVALAYGWSDRDRISRPLLGIVGGLGMLGLLSAVWSVTPRITIERSISFLILTAIAALIAAGSCRPAERQPRVLVALLAGPVIVALAGLVVLAFDYHLAVQAANIQQPTRYRGFGENPDTAAMLLAFGIPITLWFALSAPNARLRLLSVATGALLYGSIAASGSRGGMLAAFAGALTFVIIRIRRARIRAIAVVVLLGFFGATFVIAGKRPSLAPPVSKASQAAHTTTTSGSDGSIPRGGTTTTTPTSKHESTGSRFTIQLLPTVPGAPYSIPFVPEADEVGFPGLYQYKPILGYGSGRVYAWLSAIRQGLERPVTGYGFGTESAVFVDRSYIFEGAFVENSFVGMFLTLGIVGTMFLLAPFVFVAGATIREMRSTRNVDERTLVGASVVAGGFAVAFFQSYLYSVGNVGTLTFWIALFLAVGSCRLLDRRGEVA